ncbi:Uncharacterized protein DBV15_06142 [Temnothorax longispinosus]|uniref:G-protein coupled receptors family 1 profile domain-containing protein n=1 Tax=Temnothorax longispinosus TaxID=300112 RepID=A0A4S2KXB1_9HYME|nr:Uncharacterized protein DBV15_06142 [Temnothorax longispinosus]
MIMHHLQNYTDIFRRLNITDEDIDYVNSLDIDSLTGRNEDRFGSRDRDQVSIRDGSDRNETIQLTSSCYCDGVIRDLATQYKTYHGYASLIVCSFGTFTNMLNIIVLTRQDMKTVPINRILTGLATADVLVMLEYIPFAIYKYLVLPESRIFPYGWAVFVLFHMHFTQLFHTISIALTLTLAVWRYIAIRTKGRKRTLKSYSSCAAKVTTKPTSSSSGISDLENCNGPFDNKKDEYQRRPSKFDKQTDRTTRMLVVVLLLFLITEIPQGILGLLSAALGTCFFRNCYDKFGELMDILALLNGSINFILYCSMSRQFRMIFGQLFKPRIMNNWPVTNQHQTDVQSTYV